MQEKQYNLKSVKNVENAACGCCGSGCKKCVECKGAYASKSEYVFKLVFALLLTVAGGFAGCYSFTMRGGVFANMQTGNLLKIVLALVDGASCFEFLFPLLCFIAGIALVVFAGGKKMPEEIVLLLEICAFGACGVFFAKNEHNIYANCLISFACALQFQFYREACGKAFTSVMSTNNLRLAAESFALALKNKNKKELKNAAFYAAFVLAFGVGVAACALLSKRFENLTVLFIEVLFAALLVIKCCSRFFTKRSKKRCASKTPSGE